MTSIDQLQADLLRHYRPQDFPALHAQMRAWRQSRPLAGKSVLDATPIFRNTLCKYLALLAAGAQLSVYAHPDIPCDSELLGCLPNYGIHLPTADELAQGYDVICDCAGVLAQIPSSYGVVELTRSGFYRYEHAPFPVFFVDGGKLKVIETALGSGDGFLRAMQALGLGELQDKELLIFGCGKVGRGVALYAHQAGARITVIDDLRQAAIPPNCQAIDLREREEITHALKRAYCVVSATGIEQALAEYLTADMLCASTPLLANMGIVDEYGPGIPAERVLNHKTAINFLLPEPTQLKYIDPSMALNNAGVLELVQGRLHPGINYPGEELEDSILQCVKDAGLINDDLALLAQFYPQNTG